MGYDPPKTWRVIAHTCRIRMNTCTKKYEVTIVFVSFYIQRPKKCRTYDEFRKKNKKLTTKVCVLFLIRTSASAAQTCCGLELPVRRRFLASAPPIMLRVGNLERASLYVLYLGFSFCVARPEFSRFLRFAFLSLEKPRRRFSFCCAYL